MAWTQAQLDALDSAIAEGALTVKYQDKSITYRSLEEMLRVRNMMAESMNVSSGNQSRRVAEFSKGLR